MSWLRNGSNPWVKYYRRRLSSASKKDDEAGQPTGQGREKKLFVDRSRTKRKKKNKKKL